MNITEPSHKVVQNSHRTQSQKTVMEPLLNTLGTWTSLEHSHRTHNIGMKCEHDPRTITFSQSFPLLETFSCRVYGVIHFIYLFFLFKPFVWPDSVWLQSTWVWCQTLFLSRTEHFLSISVSSSFQTLSYSINIRPSVWHCSNDATAAGAGSRWSPSTCWSAPLSGSSSCLLCFCWFPASSSSSSPHWGWWRELQGTPSPPSSVTVMRDEETALVPDPWLIHIQASPFHLLHQPLLGLLTPITGCRGQGLAESCAHTHTSTNVWSHCWTEMMCVSSFSTHVKVML